MKVYCIGDSMGLPREEVLFEETWISMLVKERKDIDFIWNFQRSQTTRVLNSKDSLEYYKPDYIILQLGIVDCAPRLINRNSLFYKILTRIPLNFQNYIWKFIKRYKKRNKNTVDVNVYEFKNNLFNYLTRCRDCGVKNIFFILICTPDTSISEKSQDFIKNIRDYNSIVQNLVHEFEELICINPLNKNNVEKYPGIYVDGYHPSFIGNKIVYTQLSEIIK